MFSISNLDEINEDGSRHIGNEIVIEVSDLIKKSISQNYIFVRYMGPKFVIVFTGIQPEDTESFLKDLKVKIEKIRLSKNEIEQQDNEKDNLFSPKLNMVVTSYYKGTSMDSLTKKLEEFIDENKNENSINYI